MDLVDRHTWGARPAHTGIERRHLGAVTHAVIHYADLVARDDLEDEARAVRAIQAYHQDVKGWADIGYHVVIGMSGRAYQGRPIEQVGAHCAGFNTPSFGVCFLTDDGASLAACKAAIDVIHLTEFVALHHRVDVIPHRAKVATHCPGDRIAGWVRQVTSPGGPLARI